MGSEFENTLGQFIYWSIVIGFSYCCYKFSPIRMIGYVVIGIIIISLFFRRYVTMGIWTDAGSSFAYVSIIGIACFLGYKDENN